VSMQKREKEVEGLERAQAKKRVGNAMRRRQNACGVDRGCIPEVVLMAPSMPTVYGALGAVLKS
jgi:hypothetical protein